MQLLLRYRRSALSILGWVTLGVMGAYAQTTPPAPNQPDKLPGDAMIDNNGTTAIYNNTLRTPILQIAMDEIRTAGKQSQVCVCIPYLLASKFADTLTATRNAGAVVSILTPENPPITNYRGVEYLLKNHLPVFLEPNVSSSRECYIVISGNVNSCVLLSIPPDRDLEKSTDASILIIRDSPAVTKALLTDFTDRLAHAKQATAPSDTPTLQ